MDLTGFEGAPGVSVLHATRSIGDVANEMQNFANMIAAAYSDAAPYLVAGVDVRVNPDVTLHDVTTGRMLDYFAITPPAAVIGAGTDGAASRAIMALARHKTDLVTQQGKRLQGRTFVGPLDGSALDTSGHLTTACQNAIAGMWDGMQDIVGPVRLIVWHRYREAGSGGDPEYPGHNGEMGHVQSSTCWNKPAVLRSRRD